MGQTGAVKGGRNTNLKFMELPEEKRERIIRAGIAVFGKSDYRHASTEEIASEAGISKGLLFYYFQNKQSLYTYLFEQAVNRITEQVMDGEIGKMTDFFEYCEYAARRKYELMRKNPYILDFIMRAYYSKNEAISEDIDRRMEDEMAKITEIYFKSIDFTKFRDDVDFRDIYRMLVWMVDGYTHERQRSGMRASLDDMMAQYLKIASYLKRIAYKEEYLS